MMKKPLPIEIDSTFADDRAVWRVAKILLDGVHVSLVCVGDPGRRKTLSMSALTDSRLFVRRPDMAAAEASD